MGGEIAYVVETLKIEYSCDKCGYGRLVYQSRLDDFYQHLCAGCGHSQLLDKIYPYIKYKEIRGDSSRTP